MSDAMLLLLQYVNLFQHQLELIFIIGNVLFDVVLQLEYVDFSVLAVIFNMIEIE